MPCSDCFFAVSLTSIWGLRNCYSAIAMCWTNWHGLVSELILLSFYCVRFFLGSNKVMQVSLGRSVADEIRPGLHKVSKVGLPLYVIELYCCSVLVVVRPFIFLYSYSLALFLSSFYAEILVYVVPIYQLMRS